MSVYVECVGKLDDALWAWQATVPDEWLSVELLSACRTLSIKPGVDAKLSYTIPQGSNLVVHTIRLVGCHEALELAKAASSPVAVGPWTVCAREDVPRSTFTVSLPAVLLRVRSEPGMPTVEQTWADLP